MGKRQKDWMEKLVENYRVPPEEKSKKDKKVLSESQLKKILNKD